MSTSEISPGTLQSERAREQQQLDRMNAIENLFLFSASVALFIAAAFMVTTAFVGGRVLDFPDLLLGMSLRFVFWCLGVMTLGASGAALLGRDNGVRLVLVFGWSLNLVFYHFGVQSRGGVNMVACLGNLTAWIPISPWVGHVIITSVLLLLSTLGGCLWARRWVTRRWRHILDAPDWCNNLERTTAAERG